MVRLGERFLRNELVFNLSNHWDLITKINYLQRRIILCSISYYELEGSSVTDKQYDDWCKELIELMKSCPNVEESEYWYVYYDFDGSTGFHLYHRLNDKDKEYLLKIALIGSGKKRKGKT